MSDSFQNIAITSFPTISKIEFKPIEKQYLNVILINVFIVFLLLFSVVIFIDYKNIFEINEHSLWLYVAVSIVFMYVLFIKVVGFKKRKFAVREKDISYKKGVFYKNLTTVPFNRIQHVEIDEGPISRYFKLVSLSVFTAGDSSDDLKINGISKEEATQIKEFISTKIDG